MIIITFLNKNSHINKIKIYFLVYVFVLFSIVVFRYYNKTNYTSVEERAPFFNPNIFKKDSYIDKNYMDKSILIDKTRYLIVYEKDTDKYLVYKNFNFILGFINLPENKKITDIDETNLFDYITYSN